MLLNTRQSYAILSFIKMFIKELRAYMSEKFWEKLPSEQRFFFEMAEYERKTLELRLQGAMMSRENLEKNLKLEGKTPAEIRAMAADFGLDDRLHSLETRIRILEMENELLRKANMDLAAGKKPEEIVIEAAVPAKRIKNPGRPGIEPWEAGQMRKKRKDGWTIREIADRFGRSVGAVQRIVSGVQVESGAVAEHRNERNQSLKEARKAAVRKEPSKENRS